MLFNTVLIYLDSEASIYKSITSDISNLNKVKLDNDDIIVPACDRLIIENFLRLAYVYSQKNLSFQQVIVLNIYRYIFVIL